jgi:hypothetical protein
MGHVSIGTGDMGVKESQNLEIGLQNLLGLKSETY